MYYYIRYWNKLLVWEIPNDFVPKTSCSILIPARNEAQHIVACLQAIVAQDYPRDLFEIILIDDHSTDGTSSIAASLGIPNLKIIHLSDYIEVEKSHSFKKKAIEWGVKHAQFDLIVTTDADCIVPKRWLAFFASYYQRNQSAFIAAPVNFYQEENALERFQSLDFIGMMGITGAGIYGRFMHMCNGANLAYPKAVFQEIGGFSDIDHLASGDDMLLLQKIAKRYPKEIGFIKNRDMTVLTKAKPTWESFLQQRIRWASKSNSYTEWQVTVYLALVFFFCCSIVVNIVLIPFLGIDFLYLVLFQILVKMLMDAVLLYQTSHFFRRTDLMRSFFTSSFLHLLYIVLVGTLANLKREYVWKGRVVQ